MESPPRNSDFIKKNKVRNEKQIVTINYYQNFKIPYFKIFIQLNFNFIKNIILVYIFIIEQVLLGLEAG